MVAPSQQVLTSRVTRAGRALLRKARCTRGIRPGTERRKLGEGRGPGRGRLALAIARRQHAAPHEGARVLSFDHESRAAAAPYAGRHRKSWPAAKSSWRRKYVQRDRADRPPGAEGKATNRGLPTAYDQRGS